MSGRSSPQVECDNFLHVLTKDTDPLHLRLTFDEDDRVCPVALSLIEGCLQRDPEKRPTTEEIAWQLGLVDMPFLHTD